MRQQGFRCGGQYSLLTRAPQHDRRADDSLEREQRLGDRGLCEPQFAGGRADTPVLADRQQYPAMPDFEVVGHSPPIVKSDIRIVILEHLPPWRKLYRSLDHIVETIEDIR